MVFVFLAALSTLVTQLTVLSAECAKVRALRAQVDTIYIRKHVY
jgi:hypothetical protein